MKIGIITYDTQHLKTEQVALRLGVQGVSNLSFYALPFVYRPARDIAFQHRPDMKTGAHSRDVASAIGASYQTVASPSDIPTREVDLFLILGAGLLPADFVRDTAGRVVNSHPGIIPLVRGLDAFKWAILDGMPIGNTLHFIDEAADAGEIIASQPTPVFETDTLATFARRHYEAEIDMMSDFRRYLGARAETADHEERPARLRMPAAIEARLTERFAAYKARFAVPGEREAQAA